VGHLLTRIDGRSQALANPDIDLANHEKEESVR
jgi:hypothetical protein